ncbi:elongin A, like [Dunckerocampus dactyliophorus]|uniref:elongin A, like n=1 Tax=Dunckerocampus dactyliophorus TaxID=161453 RepID=UPI002405F223|nr:elongin A, like [Dunckerocampus dactyliophorus]
MASSSEVVKRVLRYKRQLAGTPQSATVLKILQKLNNLDVTVDVLAETGIGKTVNSLRKHKEAGELAKTLVKSWKQLLPKKSSHTGKGNSSDSLFVKEQLINDIRCPNRMQDVNNNCLKSKRKSVDTSNEHANEKHHTEKMHENEKRKTEQNEQSDEDTTNKMGILSLKNEEKCDAVLKQKKNGNCKSKSKEKLKEKSGGSHLERKSKKKSKEPPQLCDDTAPDKPQNSDDVGEDRSSGSSDTNNRKKKKHEKDEELSKPTKKKVKIQPQKDNESETEEPSMSFESYLNYDENVSKKKEQPRRKKASKKSKTVLKEQPKQTVVQSTLMPASPMPASPKKKCMESPKDLLSIPLPVILPEVSTFDYFDRKVEKEPDFGDQYEECTVFTGQRLNKKMQVYSGTKTIFLPAMMSLYQQCIRMLQNNINLLYETGSVPFEILEPVLERCTPEQLLRIEECNPVYIGVTDNLWGKHCQRDFKDAKLQQYESWKEMYIRLSEERERKFQRLAKKIVLDHSKKPKGRQVKMAFIHTVAKPPRHVRIQQEIHGTAVQQPQQPKCSVKSRESKPKLSNDPAKTTNSSSTTTTTTTTSGPGNTQDPRKKTRVAPIMAKSLKAFKKQLGRR